MTGGTLRTGERSAWRLDGKVALITGAASGIGAATARVFAENGASVVALDRSADGAKAVAESLSAIGARATGIGADVSVERDVDAACTQAREVFGAIDLLVNAAGIAIRAPAEDLPLVHWQRVIEVNLTGTFLVARAVARHMLERGVGGSIVNVASIMGLSGGGLYPNISYQASKGAVVNLTRALAIEWAPRRIRVNAVAPTWVRTPFIGALLEDPELVGRMEAATPLGRLAEPEEVAWSIAFLSSPAAEMITGHVLAVDGGFLAQ
jgi:NAD(P)-dependent dehydrogenase (short-subunit alcohol dehydrogenase family)